MSVMNDYHASKSTSGSGGKGFSCGWIVIIIVIVLLIFLSTDGASWDTAADFMTKKIRTKFS